MRDEDGSVVRPNAFLAPAKRHGLMGAVDTWVIDQAIGFVDARRAAGDPVDIAVNLSEESFTDQAFLAAAVQRMMDAPDAGQHLIFELTERTALSGRGEAQRLMARLSEFGCRFALDDFGAGTAALRHLKQLPVEFLKLDGQLTRGLPTDPADRAIAEAVISAAHALGKTVVAECVEDEAILAAVRELGVELVQGLHVGRPVAGRRAASASQRRTEPALELAPRGSPRRRPAACGRRSAGCRSARCRRARGAPACARG